VDNGVAKIWQRYIMGIGRYFFIIKLNIIMKDDKSLITFSEFPLAVALLCKNIKLLNITKEENNKQQFFVFGRQETGNLMNDFWNGELFVDAKEFWQKSRELKARMRMSI